MEITVTPELYDAAVRALNQYGEDRDWAKMRPDEMVDVVLDALRPVANPRSAASICGEDAKASDYAAGLISYVYRDL